LISLGTTICVGIFLYFYLKKRTEKIEKKVNLMFQLIQEHEKQARQQAQIMISQKLDPPMRPNENEETVLLAEKNLISVSDNDDSDDSDDSDDYDADSDDSVEISDTDTDKITITNLNLKAPLALNGAEITTNVMGFDLNKPLNNIEIVEVISVSDNDDDADESADESADEDADESADNNKVVKVIELKEGLGDDLDEITLEEPTQTDTTLNKDNTTTKSINYTEIKQEVDTLVQNITLQKANESIENPIPLSENKDLNKLKVSDLKNKCDELGLEGYKSLRKSALIELIEANLP
jgi:hypothetical protein